MIRKDKIRNSIKLVSVRKSEEIEEDEEEEEHKSEPETEAIKGQKKEQSEKVSLAKVRKAIEEIPFIPSKKEKDYESQVFQALIAKGFKVEYEKTGTKGKRFDIVVGNDEIAIEIKIIRNSSPFYGLIGQITHYKEQFEKIIVLLIDEFRNPSVMNREIKLIEACSPDKIIVVKK